MEEKGWKALSSPFKLEIDRFDQLATYFVKLDGEGNVAASIRYCSTLGSTMLSEVFERILTDEKAPASEDNWELSRYYVADSSCDGRHGHPGKLELYLGLMEHALDCGVTAFSGFMDTHFLNRAAQLGWKVELLSDLHDYGEGEGVAMNLPISRELVRKTRERLRLDYDVFAPKSMLPTNTFDVRFDPDEIRLLALYAEGRTDLIGDVVNNIYALCDKDYQAARRAEKRLSQMVTEYKKEKLENARPK